MSCLCNTDCNIAITNQLDSLHATLCKIETCLAAFADKLAAIEGRVGDWVPDDASEEEEYDDDEYITEGEEDCADMDVPPAILGKRAAPRH